MTFLENFDAGEHSAEILSSMLLISKWSSSVDHGRRPQGIIAAVIFVYLTLLRSDTE